MYMILTISVDVVVIIRAHEILTRIFFLLEARMFHNSFNPSSISMHIDSIIYILVVQVSYFINPRSFSI